jgi:ParB/RepB/Spo0J family partition protein
MNAVSPQAAPVLTDAAVKNVTLLRYLSTVPTVDRPLSKAEWARIVGKDAANLNRAMKLLTEDGVVEGWDEWPAARLTTLGLRVLSGLDVIDGRAVLPAGYALVRHDRIAPHPLNPRKDFTSPKAAEDLDALRVSILEHGVRYPLEVRPAGADGVHYLISGERRWRAVGNAIQDGDIAEDHELLVVVKPVDDEAHLVLAVEENIQRARLSYSEEASAYAYFIEALGWDPADVADKFGRSKKHVQDYLRLRTLPADVLARLDAREITYREARAMFQEHREPAAAEPEPDMFEGAPGIGLLSPDLQPKLPELSAKEALVLAELVDKADRVPAEGLEPGWTAVAETPADKVSEALIRRQMLAFRSRGPESYARAMIHSSGVKAWLEVNGFYEGVVARHGLLRQLRAEVVGEQAADDFGDRFVTAWLNPVPDAEEAEPPPERKVQPGLVGDDFSELMRRARDEEDPGGGDAPKAAGALSEPPEQAKPPIENLARVDAAVVSQAMKDVNDRLAGWRIHGSKPHWTQRKEAELEAELLAALEIGALLDVLCLLTVLRNRPGTNGGCRVLARVVEACADKAREA